MTKLISFKIHIIFLQFSLTPEDLKQKTSKYMLKYENSTEYCHLEDKGKHKCYPWTPLRPPSLFLH